MTISITCYRDGNLMKCMCKNEEHYTLGWEIRLFLGMGMKPFHYMLCLDFFLFSRFVFFSGLDYEIWVLRTVDLCFNVQTEPYYSCCIRGKEN